LAVQATPAQLSAAGFGSLNGSLVVIGQNEPGDPNAYGGAGSNVAPTSSMQDGNPNLPAGSVIIFSPTASRADHPSQVAGVIVSTIPGQQGISPGSQVTSANTSDVGQNTSGTYWSKNLLGLINSEYIVNMSWGLNVVNAGMPGGNNGNNYLSPFVDWAANTYDTTVVVAGNEGSSGTSGTALGSPSDAYNVINVGATGFRPTSNAVLDYTRLAPYTQSNMTSDTSSITGYGRQKTDLVAPGGDPFFSLGNNRANTLAYVAGAGNTSPSTTAAPANGFIDQFVSTAGGFTSAVGTVANRRDTFFGLGGGTPSTDTSTGSSNLVITSTNNIFGSPVGTVIPTTIAGTSFAAPLVSGAAALVTQYGKSQSFSVDHRLIKALLMNGAVKQLNVGGSIVSLTGTNGTTPWTRLAGTGITPPCPGFPSGFNPNVQPGLDPNLGTGEMNVVNSLVNYRAGQNPPTNISSAFVNPIGWDMETVQSGSAANSIIDYYRFNIAAPLAGSFQATLCWDDPVTISNSSALTTIGSNTTFSRNTLSGGTFNPGGGTLAPLMTDLDLYLFQLNPDNSLGNVVNYSTSDIDNQEYVYAKNLPAGNYELVVTNAQYAVPSVTPYALAWSTQPVPEPGTWVLLTAGLVLLIGGRVCRSMAALTTANHR
jgi:hypothetical protein